MAVYPCSIGTHRYGGPQRSVYLSDVSLSRPTTRKLRLCDRHYAEVGRVCAQTLEFIGEDSDSQMSMSCTYVNDLSTGEECAAPRSMVMFAKLYPGGEDCLQYAGDFCSVHGAKVLGLLGWDSAVEM